MSKKNQVPRRHRLQRTAGTRSRRTYRRDWRVYDLAQMHEQEHFGRLLRELCDTVQQPEQQMGRPRMLLSDMVFAICLMVYSMMSGRRVMTNVRRACASGQLAQVPSPTTISRYLREPEMTPLLEWLIELSAVPLGTVEQLFAVDSSDFQTSPVSAQRRWKYRLREPRQLQSKCPKAHVMVGVHTNVVTAACATDGESSDTKFLPRLVAATARRFTIVEVSADKAYSTKRNYEAVYDAGGSFYCPFRANAVPRQRKQRRDALWEQAYYFHLWHRKEFLDHYNRRSNVESAFSMVKARFGAVVRSKTPTAQTNKVLAKLLCHNLCVLVKSMYALNISPVFDDRQ